MLYLSFTFRTRSEAWIGFTDAKTEGNFEWTLPHKDGTSNKFTNWGKGEPNNVDNEDCALLSASSGFWYDIPCHGKRPFVCEFGKETN